MGTIRPNIVLFGDSLTEWGLQVDQGGWSALLSNHYSRKADVITRGFAGYNTRLALLLLDNVFPIPSPNPPALVTVFFGANDASDPKADHGKVHVPLKEYTENLHKIIAHVKKQSASTQIVLIAPPPVCEKSLLDFALPMFGDASGVVTRRNEITKSYAEECLKVAKEAGVPAIDLWSLCQDEPGWQQKYLCDGLHFSAAGNAKVFEELLKILESIPTLKSDQMILDYPQFQDFGADPTVDVKSWSTPYLK